MKNKIPPNNKIIELIRMMAWGDIMMSTAVFDALKAQGYHIRYITSEPFAPALHNNSLVDELVAIPFHRGGNPWRRYKLHQIIQEHTQHLEPATKRIWLTNSPNQALLRKLLNKIQFGLGDFKVPKIHHNLDHVFKEVNLPSPFGNNPLSRKAGEGGVVDEQIESYEYGWGPKLHLTLTPQEETWGQQYQNAILIQTASSNINKDYPAEYWQELIPKLQAQYQLPVYQICKANQAIPCVELLPNNTMREAMAAVKYCKLLISLDSAFNHVAKAFNKPCVVLFGQTHPERFGYAENINIWCGETWHPGFQPDLKQLKTNCQNLPPSLLQQGYHPYMLLNTPDVVLSSIAKTSWVSTVEFLETSFKTTL